MSGNLEAWLAEQSERQAELLREVAEQSARAAELLMAEEAGRQAALLELVERQAEALNRRPE